jgi:hypothetical protein
MDNDNPLQELLLPLRRNILAGMMVGLPGKVMAYDAESQRAQIQCGIQKHTGNGEFITLPVIDGVPVKFAGSAGWSFFHEVPVGTEGFIHFSQRSIDNWLDRGGPVPPSDSRLFNMTDAFFSPGYRSTATAIEGLPSSGIGLTCVGGDIMVHLTDSGIKLVAGGQVLELSDAGLFHNGKNIGSTHTHGGVERGGANTDVPQ